MPTKNKTKDNELKLDLSFASSNSSNTFDSLEAVVAAVNSCTLCKLCETRTNVVVFDGNPQAKLMIIGEGPGQQEDLTGRPFVGRAGQLLDKILESAEINRQRDTYICNVVKCRPPGNRVPLETEQKSCRQYLDAQIALVKPEIILLAGATAVKSVLQSNQPISKIRGQWFDFGPGIKLMPVFHPSYLLRNDSKVKGSPKWLMWQDIKEVKRVLDEVKGKRK
jgi:DNA polymerase